MNIAESIKKNSLSFIITVLVVGWLVFLTVMVVLAQRTVQFVNVIPDANGVDVSANYSSDIPLLRYLLEPLAGMIFSVVSDPVDSIVSIILLYIIARIALFAIDNTILKGRKKKEVIFAYFKDTLDYFGKWFLLAFGISLLWFLFGFLIFGFQYVNNTFQYHLFIPCYLGLVLLVYKGGSHLVRFIIPGLTPKPLNWDKEPENRNLTDRFKSRSIKEGVYLLEFVLLFLVLIFNLLQVRFPTQRINPIVPLDDDEILLDLHVHTTMSDGYLAPHDRVFWYIEQGFHAGAFSDHDNLRGAHFAQAFVAAFNIDFTVLTAEEYTVQDFDFPGTPEIHLNIIGLEDTIIPVGALRKNDVFGKSMNVSDMIKYVKSHGGYVFVNHYRSFPGSPYTYDQLRDWGVDGFEVINGGSYSDRYRDIREYCLANGLACLANTDQHPGDPAECFMKVKLDDPNDKSADAIFTALKKNQHDAVYIDTISTEVEFPSPLDQLELFENLINYLLNSDKLQVLSWIVWSGIAYLLSLLIIQGVKKSSIDKINIYKAQIQKES